MLGNRAVQEYLLDCWRMLQLAHEVKRPIKCEDHIVRSEGYEDRHSRFHTSLARHARSDWYGKSVQLRLILSGASGRHAGHPVVEGHAGMADQGRAVWR